MEIARVDLRGVVAGDLGWEATRATVTASMVAYGCVIITHDALGLDLCQAMFTRVLPDLFALPVEDKQRVDYQGQRPGWEWESLGIREPMNADNVREFTNILWSEGNPEIWQDHLPISFCRLEMIVSISKNMLTLEEMMEMLVLEGLGVREKSARGHLDLLRHSIRMSRYGEPQDRETSINMQPHCDDTMATMIVQHEVEGLEVHVGDGRWVAVPPEPGTITFMAGEQFTVVTNGRVPACLHRVRTPSSRERFSVLFGPRQKGGVAVCPLDDLVDAEHPLLYNPLNHEKYFKWRYSEEGLKFKDPLKVYCGVYKDEATAMV
ncbi:unnamed protein product [Urochloa decumbens]|uniref:Fe2OG dioxygenase domain-containing protein n=1 Tax=Urochloa decumbens TaxID=240449 RepID=A0ABC9E7E3_9POAL